MVRKYQLFNSIEGFGVDWSIDETAQRERGSIYMIGKNEEEEDLAEVSKVYKI